jgi:ABC-2 type transport system permease protein
MKPFGKLFVASLREFARDRTSLSFTILVPLLLVAFFGFAFSGARSRLNVGVVESSEFRVQSSRSGAVRSSAILAALRLNHNVKIEQGGRSTELARLRDGTIDAVVVLGNAPIRIYYARGDGTIALAAAALASELLPSISTTRNSQPVTRNPQPATRNPQTASITVSSAPGLSNSRLDFVIPGILATAIMWLGIFAAIPLVQQREQQVLRRFAVTPLSRLRLVLAQVLSRLVVSLAQAAFILAAARLLFGVPIGSQIGSVPAAVAVIVALVLLGALGFVAIGYAVAALSSTQSGAHAWAQLLTMPMLLLAGVFFPIAVLPGVLRPLIAILPLTYLADALRQTAMNGQHFVPLGVDLAVLGLWVVLPLGVAIRYFRWT